MSKNKHTGEFPVRGGKGKDEIVSVWWWQVRGHDSQSRNLTLHSSGVTGNGIIVPLSNTKHSYTYILSQPPITQTHMLPFPVSVPIWWASWPHDELLPLLLSSVHPEDAKGSGYEGWVTPPNPPSFWSFGQSSSFFIFILQCCVPATCLSSSDLPPSSLSLWCILPAVCESTAAASQGMPLYMSTVPQPASTRYPTSWPSSPNPSPKVSSAIKTQRDWKYLFFLHSNAPSSSSLFVWHWQPSYRHELYRLCWTVKSLF